MAYTQDTLKDTKLSILRKSWQRAVERARKPIDDKYISELNALQDHYTRSGNLEMATQVKKELEALQDGVAGFSFVGKWKVNVKESGWSGDCVVTDTHLIASDGSTHLYTIKGSYIRISYANHWDRLRIDQDNHNVLKGSNSGGQTITFSRIGG